MWKHRALKVAAYVVTCILGLLWASAAHAASRPVHPNPLIRWVTFLAATSLFMTTLIITVALSQAARPVTGCSAMKAFLLHFWPVLYAAIVASVALSTVVLPNDVGLAALTRGANLSVPVALAFMLEMQYHRETGYNKPWLRFSSAPIATVLLAIFAFAGGAHDANLEHNYVALVTGSLMSAFVCAWITRGIIELPSVQDLNINEYLVDMHWNCNTSGALAVGCSLLESHLGFSHDLLSILDASALFFNALSVGVLMIMMRLIYTVTVKRANVAAAAVDNAPSPVEFAAWETTRTVAATAAAVATTLPSSES